jgi:predicted nucleotidyltransferase
MPARIPIDHQRLAAFCRRHGLRRLWLFGSVLREDFGPDSDVDVLYEFLPGQQVGWDIVSISLELESILGRNVDFVPAKYLNHHLRDRVLPEAEILYDRDADPVVTNVARPA